MNVCAITTSYPLFPGDTCAPFIAEISEGIAALGHRVDVVLPEHPRLQAGIRNGVTLLPYRVPPGLWGYAQSLEADVRLKRGSLLLAPLAMHRAFSRALQTAREKRTDLIHAHWALPNGFVGARLAAQTGLPLVVSLHGSDMYLARRNPLFRRFAAWALRRARVVTACSPDLQQQAADMSGREVRLLEYGVDIAQFQPPSQENRTPFSILALGRLVHKKGFFQLMDAFARVNAYYPDSTLTIAGDGPLLDLLEERARELKVADRVHFPGNVGRSDLPGLFAAAEVVAVPSVTDEAGNRDGLPNVFLEALASGCAVVASDIPGIEQVARGNDGAVLVRSGDRGALADAILCLFNNADARRDLRAAARRKAVSELSWEKRCRTLEKLYTEATG